MKEEIIKYFSGGKYFATCSGKIFKVSHEVKIYNQTGFTGKVKTVPTRELKGGINSSGYRQVRINGRLTLVHRLIAELFILNDSNLPEVNHKDGNKLNCAVDNLEWVDRATNIKHSYATKLRLPQYGQGNSNARLDEKLVESIYLAAKSGYTSQQKIGDNFGVPQITVSNIKTKRTWKWLTDEIDKLF